jgi:hypothetical protein
VKQSRLATERMELENEHIKSITDHQKEMTKATKNEWDPNVEGSMANYHHEQSLRDAYKEGYMVPGEDGKPPRRLQGQELKDNQERMSKLHHAPSDAQEENATTTRAKLLSAKAVALRKEAQFAPDLTTEQRKTMNDAADQLDKQANDSLGVQSKATEADRIEALLKGIGGD